MKKRSTTQPFLLALAFSLLAGNANAQTNSPAATTGSSSTATFADLNCKLPTNCVTSLGNSDLAALHFEGTPEQALAALERTLSGMPEARVVSRDVAQLEVIFSTFLGFRDEVLFRVDAANQRIDFRSHSLLGLYDFGKNRSRMKDFATRFEAQRQAK